MCRYPPGLLVITRQNGAFFSLPVPEVTIKSCPLLAIILPQ